MAQKLKFSLILLFCISFLSSSNASPEVEVVWGSQIGLEYKNPDLIKNVDYGYENCGATSINVLPASTDGYIRFSPHNLIDTWAIGLSFKCSSGIFKSMNYTFLINRDLISIFKFGEKVGDFGEVRMEDIYKIERVGNVINFLKEDEIICTIETESDSSLVVETNIINPDGIVNSVLCNFTETTSSIHWIDLVGIVWEDDLLIKYSPKGRENGGARSLNELTSNKDGWVEYKLHSLEGSKAFGLASTNTDATLTTIDYCFNFSAAGVARIIEAGYLRAEFGYGSINDVYRIARIEKMIYYYKNGEIIFETETDSELSLFCDVFIEHTGASFKNITSSFSSKVYEIEWDERIGLSLNDGYITKLSPDSWENSWASGTNLLNDGQSGWIQFSVQNPETSELMIGFSTDFIPGNLNSMEYSLLLQNNVAQIYIRGELVSEIGTTLENDIYKIERKDDEIIFYKNGEPVQSFSVDPSLVLQTNLILFRQGSSIKAPLTSVKSNNPYGSQIVGCLDATRNWFSTEYFDEKENLIGKTKVYYDALGRTIQNQSGLLSEHLAIGTQTIYDGFGRATLMSLPAPIYSNKLCFVDYFIEKQKQINYSYTDYTGNKRNSPEPIFASSQSNPISTLGWYYSNANSVEPYVPASQFPFTSIEYYPDPMGAVKRTSSAGKDHKFGSGHEQRYYYMVSGGELNYVYGYCQSFINGNEQVDLKFNGSMNLNCLKNINIDEDGNTNIEFVSGDGKMIASCKSEMQDNPCTAIPLKVGHTLKYVANPQITNSSIDIHLPSSKINTLKFRTANMGTYNSDRGTIKLIDLNNERVLEESTDYSIDVKGDVQFLNDYAQGPKFLRINFEYLQTYLNSVSQNCVHISCYDVFLIEYEVDYSNWTFNYYNPQGQLVKSVSPEAFDCNIYDPLSNANIHSNCNAVGGLTLTGNKIVIANQGSSTNQGIIDSYAMTKNGTLNVVIHPTPASIYTGHYPGQAPGGSVARVSNPGMIDQTEDVKSFSSDAINLLPFISGIDESDPLYHLNINHGIDPSCGPRMWIDATLAFNIIGYNSNFSNSNGFDSNHEKILATKEFYITLLVTSGCRMVGFGLHHPNLNFGDGISLSNGQRQEFEEIRISQGIALDKSPSDFGEDIMGTSLEEWLNEIKLIVNYVEREYPETVAINQNLTNSFTYTKKNQVMTKTTSDKGETKFIYDSDGKIRFSQDALQKDNSQFSYVIYDKVNRPVESGQYNNNAGFDIWNFQTEKEYDSQNPGAHNLQTIVNQGTKDFFGSGAKNEWSRVIYDLAANDIPTSLQMNYVQTYLLGRVSKSYNDKNTTWYSYDQQGRLRWSIQKRTGSGELYTVDYNFTPSGMISEIIYQKGMTDEFHHHYQYDLDNRLVKVETSPDGSLKSIQAKYQYYLHGPLKRVELGDLQGIDYVYTINGWLKGINNPTQDPGLDGLNFIHANFANDVFSEAIDYFSGDYIREGTGVQNDFITSNLQLAGPDDHFNGLIKAQRWKFSEIGAVQPLAALQGNYMQVYAYDQFGQLTGAQFGEVIDGNLNTTPSAHQRPEFVGKNEYLLSNIQYDKNGNLLTLRRAGAASILDMDDLYYSYVLDGNGKRVNNILEALSDNFNKPYGTDIGNDGFTYNKVGQLTNQQDEDLSYTYFSTGKVKKIEKSGKMISSFEYDECGNKIMKRIYNNATQEVSRTSYVYDVYGTLIRVIETPDIQVNQQNLETNVYGLDKIGSISSDLGRTIYELKDHLGNIRATFSRNPQSNWITVHSYTDYYAHGNAMPGRTYFSSPLYKYAYQGQEVDEQTGYLNFELRLYDARLGRWFNADPMEQYFSGYIAMGNNPISNFDPNGGYSYSANNGFNDLVGCTYYSEDDYPGPKYWESHTPDWILEEERYFQQTKLEDNYPYYYSTTNFFLNDNGDLIKQTFSYSVMLKEVSYTTGVQVEMQKTFTVSEQTARVAITFPDFSKRYSAIDDPEFMSQSAEGFINDIADGNFGRALKAVAYNMTSTGPGGVAMVGPLKVAAEISTTVLPTEALLRIENAATRINKPITVVGSRADGTAQAFSDWDYVITGLTNKDWKMIKNSLPGARSVLDNTPRNIDIFKGPVNYNLPHITIYPR